MKRFLIIQTAFIGDVILALPIAQELRRKHPGAEVHFLLRKGNESLLEHHPDIHKVWVWDKKNGKYHSWFRILRGLRRFHFDAVYNCHRFASSGILCALLHANEKVCFDKQPFRFFFSRTVPHPVKGEHEVDRNLSLLGGEGGRENRRPRLFLPTERPEIRALREKGKYLVVAPASVWFSKQLPADTWRAFLRGIPGDFRVMLVGGKNDFDYVNSIRPDHDRYLNLCGELSLNETALLMKDAERVFCNDSAPLHLASAVNAPVSAIFCSTVPAFGFGPLSDDAILIEAQPSPACRPCGLAGKATCPVGHFHCGKHIRPEQLLESLDKR